jgi:hypothetical protein
MVFAVVATTRYDLTSAAPQTDPTPDAVQS